MRNKNVKIYIYVLSKFYGMTQKMIAEKVGVSRPRVTVILKSLEGKQVIPKQLEVYLWTSIVGLSIYETSKVMGITEQWALKLLDSFLSERPLLAPKCNSTPNSKNTVSLDERVAYDIIRKF